MPVEVKYGKIDIKGILTFMKKFKADKGFKISMDKEEKLKIDRKNIFIAPAYKFLLMDMLIS